RWFEVVDDLWAPAHHRFGRVEDHPTGVGRELSPDQVEQGGLSGSVFPHQAMPGTAQGEVDSVEEADGRRIGERNGFEMHCRHGGLPSDGYGFGWVTVCGANVSLVRYPGN